MVTPDLMPLDMLDYMSDGVHTSYDPQTVATYRQAAEWIKQNPDEAAVLIAPKSTPDDQKAIAELIRSNDRLSMHVASAAGMRKEIEAVYRAGQDVGYFPKAPSIDSVYPRAIP